MHCTTQEKILRSAKELFARKGFKAASMADIAGQVGITKAALYYFFKNKEHLYAAIISGMVDDIEQCLARGAAEERSLSGVIGDLIEIGLRTGTMFQSIEPGSMDKRSIVYKEMGIRMGKVEHAFQDLLRKRSVPEPELAGEILLNAIHAYVLRACCGTMRTDIKQYSEYLAKVVKK
jgi:AcrR family transcriptional regulator